MADWRLLVAATLLTLAAAAHSYLGERYILIRLFRRTDLPRIGPGDWFTKRTMRFAWHLTSVAWLGFAALLTAPAFASAPADPWLLGVTAVVFAVHGATVLVFSHGRHLAWPVFLAVAGLCAWAAA